MITLPAAVRVYLCTTPCDMRRGFDGLKMLAQTVIGVDPLGGHLFCFCSRRADRVKILYWDRDGWALWAKRLEAGTYAFPFDAAVLKEIRAGELAALLEGIDLTHVKRRKRYRAPDRRMPLETA
jgi:transposase